MRKFSEVVIIILIFFLALFIWNSPAMFKGYGFTYFTPDQSLTRNLLKTGKFSIENKKNVMLTSSKISEEGEISSRGNKLNPIISSYIYRVTGLPEQNEAIFICSVIHSLALLFFALTVKKLFGNKEAILFSLVYIFLPVIWLTAQTPIFYEFSLFFLALAMFLYFNAASKPYKHFLINYILVGIFLGLSFLSRDAISLFAPGFFIWLFFNNKKAIIPIFSSLIIIFITFYSLSSFLMSAPFNNNQHLTFFSLEAKVAKYSDFGFYGHLYPDPYTFHYNRALFLKDIKETSKLNDLESINISKSLKNIGESKISIGQKIKLIPILLIKHISRLFSLEDIGGPFISLFIILGLWYLYAKKDKLWQLSILWIGSVVFILSFIIFAQRQHMMDFGFILAVLISLGIIKFVDIISLKDVRIKASHITFLITAVVIYQFILSAHIALSRSYDNSNFLKLRAYGDEISSNKVFASDIIATPLNSSSIDTLNYLTDKSIIKFDNETIVKLLEENKIDWAFKEFGVTKIIGFSPELTAAILEKSDVKNIADNTIKSVQIPVSSIKSLFMNLVK